MTFSSEELEFSVIKAVEYMSQKQGMAKYQNEVTKFQNNQRNILQKSISEITKEMKELSEQKSNAVNSLILHPNLNPILLTEIEQKVTSLNNRLGGLETKRNELQDELLTINSSSNELNGIKSSLKDFKDQYSDRQAVRGWLRGLFSRIEIDTHTNKIKIFWNSEITNGKLLLPYKTELTSGSRKLAIETKLNMNESTLHDLAVTKKMTSSQIARELDVSRSTVSKYLKKFNISRMKVGSNKKRVRGLRYGKKALSNGKMIRVSSEEKIVRAIRIWREQGKSFREIASILNIQRVPTKTGKGHWHGKTIQQLGKTIN